MKDKLKIFISNLQHSRVHNSFYNIATTALDIYDSSELDFELGVVGVVLLRSGELVVLPDSQFARLVGQKIVK